jgi:hypothetical protein
MTKSATVKNRLAPRGEREEIAQQMILYCNYSWTHDQHDDIEFTSTGLKFANNGTVILNK